jgi:hypothetical protein
MSTEQAAPADEYRAPLYLTLPASLVRRMEPYKAQRQRAALIRRAIERELDRLEQEQQPA